MPARKELSHSRLLTLNPRTKRELLYRVLPIRKIFYGNVWSTLEVPVPWVTAEIPCLTSLTVQSKKTQLPRRGPLSVEGSMLCQHADFKPNLFPGEKFVFV